MLTEDVSCAQKNSPVNAVRDSALPLFAGHRRGGVGCPPTENARQFSVPCVLTGSGRHARNRSYALKIRVYCLVKCPERDHIWDSGTKRALKNHGKSASGAGSANYRYWDSWRPPKPAAPQAQRRGPRDGEIARLIDAAGKNRYGHRDATMVLLAYRHGLRAGELVTLRWDAIDFAHG